MSPVKPTREPDFNREAVCFNPVENNNKVWGYQYWEKEGVVRFYWGRVGASYQEKVEFGNLHYADQKLSTKTSSRNPAEKRYTEVQKASKTEVAAKATAPKVDVVASPATTPSTAIAVIQPEIYDFVKFILGAAKKRISEHLEGQVDTLSVAQIQRGRNALKKARDLKLAYDSGSRDKTILNVVLEYCNTIPTIWKFNLRDTDRLVREFYGNLSEYNDRLDQLEAAIATFATINNQAANNIVYSDPVIAEYKALGVDLTYMSPSDNNYAAAVQMVETTLMDERARIKAIYKAVIPNERAAFNAHSQQLLASGISPEQMNMQMMFHGTRRYNVHNILLNGLIIPTVAANGSRFGRGIYNAPKAARSLQYTDYTNEYRGRAGLPWTMFINQIQLGKCLELSSENSRLVEAPKGYDSVCSLSSNGGRGGEYIVYKPQQQTIRMVVLFEPK